MGEGKDGMIWENSIETCILSTVNRSPVQVWCMRQVLRAGALGWLRGLGWVGRWDGGSGWGTYVNPWLIRINVWQKPLQYCKVISLQLIYMAGGEGDDRGWDGSMAPPTQWAWVWVNSGSWWWAGRPGVLWFMGSQRVGHDWVTELNWI